MRAVGYQAPLPINNPNSLQDIELTKPVPTAKDLLVEVRAVSVNPVDTKVRASATLAPGQWRVLGWDAAGIVTATGPEVRNFAVGDKVFYAGSLHRPGTNSQFHLVDERIVGHMPKSLDWAQAAALPLTAITAWEMLFDRLDIRRPVPGNAASVLIVGGAGGVGSIAIQLVRALTDLTIIATASRPETQEWVRILGAHHVIDHRSSLAGQVARLPTEAPGFVFCTTHTDQHFADTVELLAPQGRLGLIDDPQELDALPLKHKSLSLHWEVMFTRPMFETSDMAEQGKLLNEIAALVDSGRIRTTLGENFGPINADNLRCAHALIESGRAKGKIVLTGFGE
ncbi:zinc-dependent alcohol dehydrogenase [Acetobacter nitrogenifigens DSM 23921 = NBRC 105050]|uniref:Zinc-type alcohol dehydrogenase-like protein n=1 Tax=Acetobacter nitrogenifigens DSM 23921 = NBRC 105050 TaxID=1120919 RepID=A0A511XAJ2_9PROT|nr:zinc-binding alcohol dehydrogenase family protein [Acetobacter nitrogenifigens]GBQ91163.1 zinc-dependent alcohol dehydrogenase [Acetobacter nitrogenifigens DSM 23921 = NBRC 105050]GEN59970.1 Zn-dependent oxidoreductase [Acetobacter nitrogenifigens DSM 23921 = NBRC 105050]